MLTDIKACIFDMDGTLIDSMNLWYNIDTEYFEKYGKKLPKTYQSEIEGLSVIETAIYTKEHYGFESSVDEMVAEWNEMAYEHYAKNIKYKPYAEEFLNSLKQKGMKLGIATSNSKTLFNAFAENSGLYNLIDVVITGEDVKKGKPNGECYLKVAKSLKVKPEECLVFEDICMGIMAGINAGMRTCAVADTYSERQWKEKIELADYHILSYEELCEE